MGSAELTVEEAIAAYEIHAQLEVITDGEEAMRRLDHNNANTVGWPPDLFVLDLNLPKRSGSEILARIRQKFECAHTPVLVMTSSDSETDPQQTMGLGSSGYFRNPSGFDEFLKIGALIKLLLAAAFWRRRPGLGGIKATFVGNLYAGEWLGNTGMIASVRATARPTGWSFYCNHSPRSVLAG